MFNYNGHTRSHKMLKDYGLDVRIIPQVIVV